MNNEQSPIEPQTGRPAARRRMWPLVLVVIVALAGAFWAYRKTHARPGADALVTKTGQAVYHCPMHPGYTSDKPGNCPICSMKLVKQEPPSEVPSGTPAQGNAMPGMQHAGHGAPMGGPTTATGGAAGTTIAIPPERQQLIGVRSVPVSLQRLEKEIRTVGKVAYDETRVSHVHTKVSGYIEEVFADFVGKAVKNGDPLFTIYSPDLVATQQEYLLALKSRSVLKDSKFPWVSAGSDNLVDAARSRLRLWDISEKEIEALESDRKVKRALVIYSPVSGIVTERAAYHHGRFVNPEMDLYTIVDVSKVWVLAQVYESDLAFARVGQQAEVEFPYGSGVGSLRGRISFLYPFLDPKTRTTQIRLEFSNAQLRLKPDMFVNVTLRVNLGTQLVVPEDALLDTGTEQYVFVDKGSGNFEARLVKAGPQAGGFYGIQSGLKAGERVVTSANFIIDSESRLKGAFGNLGAPPHDTMKSHD